MNDTQYVTSARIFSKEKIEESFELWSVARKKYGEVSNLLFPGRGVTFSYADILTICDTLKIEKRESDTKTVKCNFGIIDHKLYWIINKPTKENSYFAFELTELSKFKLFGGTITIESTDLTVEPDGAESNRVNGTIKIPFNYMWPNRINNNVVFSAVEKWKSNWNRWLMFNSSQNNEDQNFIPISFTVPHNDFLMLKEESEQISRGHDAVAGSIVFGLESDINFNRDFMKPFMVPKVEIADYLKMSSAELLRDLSNHLAEEPGDVSIPCPPYCG